MKKVVIISSVFCLAFAACSHSEDDKVLQVQEYSQIMKTGKELIDPVHGKEVKFYYGAVSGVEGVNANGVAYARVYEDGFASVTVNVNIELAATGTKYVAYIQTTSGDASVKMGEVTSIVGDVRHSGKFETKEDVTKMLSVKVRREGKGGSALVAEGTLKEPAPAR